MSRKRRVVTTATNRRATAKIALDISFGFKKAFKLDCSSWVIPTVGSEYMTHIGDIIYNNYDTTLAGCFQWLAYAQAAQSYTKLMFTSKAMKRTQMLIPSLKKGNLCVYWRWTNCVWSRLHRFLAWPMINIINTHSYHWVVFHYQRFLNNIIN